MYKTMRINNKHNDIGSRAYFPSSSELTMVSPFLRAAEITLYISYSYTFFISTIFPVENLSPIILLIISILSVLGSPNQRWLYISLPVIMILVSSFVISHFFYTSPDMELLKGLLFWTNTFIYMSVLIQVPGFFDRIKVILIFILLFHFFFLAPDPRAHGVSFVRFQVSEETTLNFRNPNDIGYWCGFGVIASLIMFIRRTGWKSILFGLLVLLNTIVLSMSLTIGSIIDTLLALLVGFLLGMVKRLKSNAIIYMVLIILLGTLFFGEEFRERYTYFTLRLDQEKEGGYTATGRIPRLVWTWELISSGGEVFWIGRNNREFKGLGGKVTDTHNTLANLWLMWGILPVIFYVMLWYRILRNSYKIFKNKLTKMNINYIELLMMVVFIFILSNTQNWIITHPFVCLYMVKILSLRFERNSHGSLNRNYNSVSQQVSNYRFPQQGK